MVHCSLGHDTTKVINRPKWWPQDVKFSNPLTRPEKINDVSNFLLFNNNIYAFLIDIKYYKIV